MNNKKIFNICLDGLLIALLCISAQIAIPLGIAVFTLQLLCVFIIGNITNIQNSLLVILIYIVMGLIGIPVFASFSGGFAYIAKPTFGFVYGFLFVVLIQFLLNSVLKEKIRNHFLVYIISSSISLFVLYIIGFVHGYFILDVYKQSDYTVGKLLYLFILPYIPFDLVKVALAAYISTKVEVIIDYEQHEFRFDSIDSTSTYLKHNYAKLDDMTIVSANFQTAGHGRMERKWLSEKKANLMFSILIKDEELIKNFDSISVGSAVSIINVLEQYKLQDVQLKWPNDVYVKGQKICGILLESISEGEDIKALVLGIGINVNTLSFPPEIQNNTTSLALQKNKKISLFVFKHEVYKTIRRMIKKIKNGNKDYLYIANNRNYLKGKTVYASIEGKDYLVTVHSINEDNSLCITINGEEKNIRSGEITFHKPD